MEQETKAAQHNQPQISQRPFEVDYIGFGRQVRKSRLDSGLDPGKAVSGTAVRSLILQ